MSCPKGQDRTERNLNRLAGHAHVQRADLAAIINEAALAATMSNKDFIEMADLEEARDKVRLGTSQEKPGYRQQGAGNHRHHEAGHTLVQSLLKDADPLHKVSIIPRGRWAATFALPEKDRDLHARYCTARC